MEKANGRSGGKIKVEVVVSDTPMDVAEWVRRYVALVMEIDQMDRLASAA